MIAFAKLPVRRSGAFCFALIVIFLLLARETLSAEASLTNCVDILQLPVDRLKENKPVILRGVITCYQPLSQLCFVQDGTAGIYVFPSAWTADFSFGDVVEVKGATGIGRFSPIVHTASIRNTGQRAKISPKPVAVEDLNTGRFDSQWVQVQGVVQTVDFADKTCTMQLWNGCTTLRILAFGFERSPTNLIDATVLIQGVGGTFYDEQRLAGFGLFSQDPGLLKIVAAAPDPFETPLRTARSLPHYSKQGGLDHRVRVRGVVSVVWPGEALFIQDESGPLRVQPAALSLEPVAPGDVVEAAGFIRDLTEIPRLAQAVFRKNSSKAPPEPLFLKPKELASIIPAGQYVTTSGVLFGSRTSESGYTLLDLEFENRMVTAVLSRESISNLIPGSLIRISGAWSSPPGKLREQIGPVVWMNSKAALTVLALPKSGPTPSLTRNLTLGGCAAALLLIGLIAVRERRRSYRLSIAERAATQRLLDTEREITRLNDGRERLGRDLHDRIIQSIYAIGLNLDDCAQADNADPSKIQTRLRAALKDVNGVIGELRNVILGLETNAIQPREFRTALKSLSLALGNEETKNRIRSVIDEDAVAALTPGQATELVHIAREAMSNSIRHGNAYTTVFRLELREETIVFSIEDDGRGFNPNKVAGTGFGLRNMAKRAESLGAKFSISSEEGQGTRVTLDIPRQKQHFSTHEPRTSIDR